MGVDIGSANREAVDRLRPARRRWPAGRRGRGAVALGGPSPLPAGPPIDWDRMCSPMRGAVTAAILSEGWAKTPEDAERVAASGGVAFSPCHSRGAVGPMAGVISPSTPVLVVEDPV